MRNGVTIIHPETTHISADAVIGRDTVIQPGSMIEGATVIGEDCIIGPNTQIIDSRVGDRTTIHSSVVRESALQRILLLGHLLIFDHFQTSVVMSKLVTL